MLKKLIAVLICIFTIASAASIAVFAEGDDASSLEWNFDRSKSKLTVSGKDGLVELEGEAPWEQYKEKIKTLEIKDGTVTVGKDVFSELPALETVNFPDTVTEIGENAFYECKKLKNIKFPENLEKIGAYAFNSCGISSLTLPVSLLNIEDGAFFGCKNLKSVTFNEGLLTIGAYTFSECEKLETVTVPNTVEFIGDHGFSNCKSLTDAVLSDEMTNVNEMLFGSCEKLVNVKLPAKLSNLGDLAFMGCTSLSSVILPEKLNIIGYGSFSGCTALNGITVPDKVCYLCDEAFEGCASLGTVILPKSMNGMGAGVFHGTAYYKDPANWENGVLYVSSYLIDTDKEKFITDTYEIKDGTVAICGAAFKGCGNLKSVRIPDSCRNICDEAFSSCSALESVNFHGGLKSIGVSSFTDCTALKSVEICDGTAIYTKAFENCSSLSDIKLGNSITRLEIDAFNNTGFYNNERNWKNGGLYIGNYLICAKSEEAWFSIKNGTVYICESAFSDCGGITKLTVPKTVEFIGTNAFSSCTGISTVIFKGKEEGWRNIVINSGNNVLYDAGKIYALSGNLIKNFYDIYIAENTKTVFFIIAGVIFAALFALTIVFGIKKERKDAKKLSTKSVDNSENYVDISGEQEEISVENVDNFDAKVDN